MTAKTPTHLCLTCNLAEWDRTESGRLHPSGDGRCRWKFVMPTVAAAFYWTGYNAQHPVPSGGSIERRPKQAIVECPVYEPINDKPAVT